MSEKSIKSKGMYFSQIKVEGYRGRKFTLKTHPGGVHTVFIMDGNVGKTTTIELMRWCFRYRETQAEGNFRHMWSSPAHVLDDNKRGKQTCEITIQFYEVGDRSRQRFYQFKRVTQGRYDREFGDRIDKIYDVLEIDHGKEVKEHDEAHKYLESRFGLEQSAEWFCFDGEKAREVLQVTGDKGKIQLLTEMLNTRTTHPELEDYKRQLRRLTDKILEKAKTRMTDRAKDQNLNRLSDVNWRLSTLEDDRDVLKRDIRETETALSTVDSEYEELEGEMIKKGAEVLREQVNLERDQKDLAIEIGGSRRTIFEMLDNWFSIDPIGINKIKTELKERGKLPEPYRRDLIRACMDSNTCEICGRALDGESKKRVKELEKQIAPHNVHDFLSSEFTNSSDFNPRPLYEKITRAIKGHVDKQRRIESLRLSKEDEEQVSKRQSLKNQRDQLRDRRKAQEIRLEELSDNIKVAQVEMRNLEGKIDALKGNMSLLQKIDESLATIETAEERIRERTVDIISRVINESIASILGDRFSAKLSETEGLLLGEDGVFGREKGGMSGRMILSYCFAEAMKTVEPMIVDTPSGPIGSHREALAKHLVANNQQLILLCLPTELQDFAPHVDTKPIVIVNED